jgi:hypothetical protein
MPISLPYNAKGASKLSGILHDQEKKASTQRVGECIGMDFS